MKRHAIARLLRRMAELEEQRTRVLVLEAQTILVQRERARDDLIEQLATREAEFIEHLPYISGAILAMLNQARLIGERKIEAMRVSISEVRGVLETRQQEHFTALRRQDGRRELEQTMRRRWLNECEKHATRQLEDTTTSSRWMRAHEEAEQRHDRDHLPDSD